MNSRTRRRSPTAPLATGAIYPLVIALVLLVPLAGLAQAQPTQALTGAFTVSIAPDDVPASEGGGAALVGLWTLSLHDDGAFILARQDVGQVATGAFTSGSANLAFTAWQGIVGCAIPGRGRDVASYAWQREGQTITLTAIDDPCADRRTLLTTRALGAFDACPPAAPQESAAQPPAGLGEEIVGTPVPGKRAGQGVAAQEGSGPDAGLESDIDRLLGQASACWATGDVERFMALHGRRLADEIGTMGPAADFNRELRRFMATPATFSRIGAVTLTDSDHAWAYVEFDLNGAATPQRVNFVRENGTWRFDSFILFGPPQPTAPPGIAP